MGGDEFYREIRDQIKHEDGLCNARITWLITLQSFLFAGYGLTISAQVSATANKDLPADRIDQIAALVTPIRTPFCYMGIASSALILLSLIAARISIARLVATWYDSGFYRQWLERRAQNQTIQSDFPPIIGTHTDRARQGLLFGQLPLYGIPCAAMAIWVYLYYGNEFALLIASIPFTVIIVLTILYMYNLVIKKT